MPRRSEIPLADVDQLAEWLFCADSGPHFKSWSSLGAAQKQRSRCWARKLLSNPPLILRQYVKLACARELLADAPKVG